MDAGSSLDDCNSFWYQECAAVLAATVAGARYGIKIRLPHALVMTFMFRRDLTTAAKLRVVYKAVAEHARSLGSFAFAYKACLLLLKAWNRQEQQGSQSTISTSMHALGRILIKMIGECSRLFRCKIPAVAPQSFPYCTSNLHVLSWPSFRLLAYTFRSPPLTLFT